MTYLELRDYLNDVVHKECDYSIYQSLINAIDELCDKPALDELKPDIDLKLLPRYSIDYGKLELTPLPDLGMITPAKLVSNERGRLCLFTDVQKLIEGTK